MKILHVINWFNFGGSEELCLTLCSYLDEFEHILLAYEDGPLRPEFEKVVGGIFFDKVHSLNSFDYINGAEIINELRPDLVHVHIPGGENPTYLYKIDPSIPIVMTILCPRTNTVSEDILKSIIVLSNHVKDLNQSSKKVRVVDCGFNRYKFRVTRDREEVRKELGINDNDIVLGRNSNLLHLKRVHDNLVLAGRMINQRNVKFIISGWDKHDPQYANYISNLSNELPNVIFLGTIANEEKFNMLNAFDVFLCPTTHESFGVIFLEAMAAGLPIISYDDSAMPTTIGDAGILVERDDLEMLYEETLRIVTDSKLRRYLAKKSRQRLIDKFAPERFALEVKEIYLSALSES